MTILAQWDGDHFAPLGRYRKQCDRDYVVGQAYTIDVILDRSDASHRHFFASIHDLWMNLPEGLSDRFHTSEHLRKYALIKAGFHDERSIVCSSPAEASRIAAFIQPMDEYAVVTVSEYVVRVFTAKSQSKRAMGAKEFQDSKQKVLDLISEMIGVTRQQLERATA